MEKEGSHGSREDNQCEIRFPASAVDSENPDAQEDLRSDQVEPTSHQVRCPVNPLYSRKNILFSIRLIDQCSQSHEKITSIYWKFSSLIGYV